jgi:hypothetical protein
VRRLLDMPEPPDTPGKGVRLWWTRPVDGMTYEQIGERLGCSPTTARRWAQADEMPAPRGRPARFTGGGDAT